MINSNYTYLIFVNFGTPPHYLGLQKVHRLEKSTQPLVVMVVTNISYAFSKHGNFFMRFLLPFPLFTFKRLFTNFLLLMLCEIKLLPPVYLALTLHLCHLVIINAITTWERKKRRSRIGSFRIKIHQE